MNKISGARRERAITNQHRNRLIQRTFERRRKGRERKKERESWEKGLHGEPFEMDELNYLYTKRKAENGISIPTYAVGAAVIFLFTDFTF